MKYVTCGDVLSIWTPIAIGRSSPFALRFGDISTVTETFPLPFMVLKLTKSYSLYRVSVAVVARALYLYAQAWA